MAHKHQYLVYYIHLTDLAVVKALQFTGSPDTVGAVLAAPDGIAIERSAPKLAKTAPFVAPCLTSDWFGTEDHFPTNVPTFDRKSGGWFGIPFLFGDTTTYHWRGQWTYAAPPTVPGVLVPINIAARTWIDGFEIMDAAAGVVGPENGKAGDPNNDNRDLSRSASRTIEGLGWARRSSTVVRTHNMTENGGVAQQNSWERVYFRLRGAPLTQTRIWKAKSSTTTDGWAIEVMPSGQLAIGYDNSVSVFTVVGSVGPLALDKWTKVDLRFWFGTVPLGGNQFEIWLNGAISLSGTLAGGLGPGLVGQLHGTSTIGDVPANTLAIDIDDWIRATHQGAPDGVDFQNGSHVVQVLATGFDASMAGYTGDWRWALLNPTNDGDVSLLASATNGAVLAVTTDAALSVDAYPNSLGAVAAVVQALLGSGGTVADTITMTGGLGVTTVVPVGGAVDWKRKLATISGATPTAIRAVAPMLLKYTKASALAQTIRRLSATVEMIGTFGTEDIGPAGLPATPLPANTGTHNAPYPRTPWARLTVAPIQPVFIRSGQYVGNGVGQDLAFPSPIHFFFVRALTGATAGAWWFSSMVGSHRALLDSVEPQHIVQAMWDSTFVPLGLDGQQEQYLLRIAGASTLSNANGVTYQFLAIGDPGQRYMMNGALKNSRINATITTPLVNATWTPVAAFLRDEKLLGISNTGFYKGPGHAAASVSPLDAVELPNALSFALGNVLSQNALHSTVNAAMLPFSLWRTDDGSSDDVGSNRGKVVQIGSYVGNGAASRSINLQPAVGKRPLFAMVVPHNAAARLRDAAHTLLSSQDFANGTIGNLGITGGDLDSITVDVALNANGVIYEYLAIPGSSAAGNGGFSTPGDFWPVPPDPPPNALGTTDGQVPGDPPADAVVPDVVIPDPLAPTGPMPGLTDDLDAACTADTHRIANVALSRIGIMKQVTDLATQTTSEAVAVRLEYPDAVQATLRDFPWPFATRYAQLALVNAGVQPNSDWRYAYRQPTDCLFERRLVVSRAGAVDPAPPPFQLSTDDTGGLIFTNLASAILEYTARPKCPHTRSEPLFRDAVSWKLAAAIAPSLTRMTDAAVNCTKMYWATIEQARQVLRPDNPGATPDTPTVDVAAAAQAANVAVVNHALVRIGARTIRNLSTDQSREAQNARLVFEDELRATLRDFPWPFATVYVAPVLVAGTATAPVNLDWQYSYRVPADLLFARRLLSATGLKRAYDPNPPTFKLGQDVTGGLLYTDLDTPTLEYTTRPEGAVLVADPLFRDAFSWRLAATLAASLAQASPDDAEAIGRGPADPKDPRERRATNTQLRAGIAKYAWQQYQYAIRSAHTAAANEVQQDHPGDPDWISGR